MEVVETIKTKLSAAKEKVKEKTDEGKEKVLKFVDDHPEVIIPVISGLGMLTAGIFSGIMKSGSKRIEHCRVQDDVTDEYFLAAHPLTNDEILELGDRMIDGQRKGDALEEMGLLKKEKRRK